MTNKNQSLIDALRQAADFLESKPELPKLYGPCNAAVHIPDREEFAAAVKMLGEFKAVFCGDYFFVNKNFGEDVQIRLQTDRDVKTPSVMANSRPGDESLLKLVGAEVSE